MADLTTDALVAIVLVIVVGIVVFLEWRLLRSRREGRLQAAIEQDDAFNSIITTRAIAQALRDQGRDVLAGEVLIHQAESAYERRNYRETLEIAEKARNALKDSKMSGELVYCPPTKTENETQKIGPKEECIPAFEAAKKLPHNYLEAKFIIETAEGRIENMDPEEAKEARVLLSSAKKLFDEENYTESLKYAMKARRLLDSDEKETITAPRTKAAAEEIVSGVENGSGVVTKCPSCSTELVADDIFCRKCGAKVHSQSTSALASD